MTKLKAFDIDTPALLIDLDAVDNNLAAMQKKANTCGVSLRPHIKAHKIPELALRQVDLGGVGVTAAKLSEAEVMADAGINDIFIANQIITTDKLRRLANLSKRANLSIGLDSISGAKILSEIFSNANATLDNLIEINSGLDRCGVLPGQPAVTLYQSIEHRPGLRFKGLFTHAGQAYAQQSLEAVKAVSLLESRLMVDTARRFKAIGVTPEVVSVGSTPTMLVWEGCRGITEIRPGNYIFLDAIQVSLGVAGQSQCALSVLSTITSRPERDRAVIDAGSKVLALDKGAHGNELVKGYGMVLGAAATIERLSEEHGIMSIDPGGRLDVGRQVRIIPNHACTVINLADKAYGIRHGKVVEEFKIAARGKVH